MNDTTQQPLNYIDDKAVAPVPTRRLVARYPYWSDEPPKRYRWEDTGRVRFCAIGTSPASNKIVVESLNTISGEFGLPLDLSTADLPTQEVVRDVLERSATDRAINWAAFLRNLNEAREQHRGLQAAMVISFDGQRYRIDDPNDRSSDGETAEWGITDHDGVILLRLMPGQPLANLVRHEMGHLLGLGPHHPKGFGGCVNVWECSDYRFCDECRERIRQTCEVIALPD